MGFRRRWPGVSYGRGEDWHYVGDTDEPAFENSWANVSTAPKLAFRLRESGIVDIQGTIEDGTSTTVFTLPEGYRPSTVTAASISAFVTGTGRVSCLVSIQTSGAVDVFVDTTGAGSTYPDLANFGSAQFFLDPPDAA